jgi:hypothetical protein
MSDPQRFPSRRLIRLTHTDIGSNDALLTGYSLGPPELLARVRRCSSHAGFDDPEFWNWHGRGPACLNPPAVRSVLPQEVALTNWALEGDTREQIAKKAQAAYASHQFTDPAPDSFAFMLSKQGYLNDGVAGPWHPHVMLFVAYDQMATWAAGFAGSPIVAPPPNFRPYQPVTISIPVHGWSDGSLDHV